MDSTSRNLQILKVDLPELPDRDDSALARIADLVRRHGTGVALRLGGQSVTYRELWAASGSVRTLIENSCTDADRPVALCLDKHDARMFASMLAVLRCDRFFVVIDPTYPEARNRLVLEDADPSLVLAGGPGGLPSLQELVGTSPDPQARQRDLEPDPDTIACLVYTSGSTGRPKGVMVPRGALAQIARIQGSHIGIERGMRMSLLSSASVFGGMRTIWGGLTAGATICPFTVETSGLDRMAAWLREERIAVLHCTPSVLRHFGKSLPAGARFDSMRTVILGADRVLAEDVQLSRTLFGPAARVWTGLGASETGTVSGRLIDAAVALPEGQMPLGAPVPGREVLLLDDQGVPVAEGETGELVVEGFDLALGYWRLPERSAEVFGNTAIAGRRRYRTGDLARVMPDGALMHMGRRDFMVKVRGVRVDLGEVEAVLARCAVVRECALRADTDALGEVSLVAFVQFRDAPGLQVVRDHLAANLPPAMRPRTIVVVEDWPRTVSGKLDRKALKVPDAPAGTPEADLRGDIETQLAGIWSAVLERPVTHRDTDFFEAGGNSLSAMRVVVRVNASLSRELPPASLFRAPRLADFASLVESTPIASPTTPQPVETARSEGPLSPAQRALWLVEKLEGSGSTYNIGFALKLTGALDRDRLARAVDALCDRHEALRTLVHESQGEVVQKVLTPGRHSVPRLPRLQFSDVPVDQPLSGALDAEFRLPISISGGPLWRARLFSQGAADHALVLTMHHIVCDGWSLQILAEDLAALYSADGQALPPPGGRLIDEARAAHARAAARRETGSLAFWTGQLAGLGTLDLPTDRAQVDFQSAAGATLRLPMPAALHQAAAAFAQAERVTPFAVLLTAFQVVLARHSGSPDFGIGIPAANRPRPELEGVVGYFVNMLVARATIDDSSSFRSLVQQVHARLLEGMARQDVAFEQIVEALSPVRSGNRNPLFQVAFTIQNQPRGRIAFAGLRHELLSLRPGTSKFDLTLEVGGPSAQPWIELEYRTALFEEATVARLGAHFLELLASATVAPDSPATTLPLLAAAERRQLLEEWNATAVPRPEDERLDALVLAQCARTPDAVAMVSGGVKIRYGELAARVAGLRGELQRRGVAHGEPVGVRLPRSPDLIVASLAILQAGGIYVPLDPRWPDARVKSVIDTAGARLVLYPDSIRELPGSEPPRAADPDARVPDPTAYILFTSGSTGAPKGVEIGHAAFCNHHRWFIDCTGLTSGDAVLFRTAPTFDISLAEMFSALMVGGRIVIARDEGEQDPDYIARLMRDEGVTLHQATPSSCRLLLASKHLAECTSLRWFACGGEALDMELARALHRALPRARVGNFYGPTEATIWATFQEITDWDAPIASIGRPIANLRCHVLDDRLQLQPVGVWGELYLGGAGVARGYCQRPDLTAERFIDDPFHAGGRLYRTGDRARWRSDGTLEFAGRRDGQVKIRGHRVELGEIESALQKQADIAQAVVAVVDGADAGSQALVAFVVAAPGRGVEVNRVKDRLALSVPRYMIPARIEVREALPLLTSGKVDRKALAASLQIPGSAGSHVAMPAAALAALPERERNLLALWREVLDRPAAGVDDDFFALGGHSLLAFRLAERIQQQLELPCSLRMLFTHPTVRQLSQALGESLRQREGAAILPLQELGTRPPLYCICGIQLYRELAQALAPEIPVRGVFLPWEEAALRTGGRDAMGVEDLAARYIEAIRAGQPEGPFNLLGVSFGGVLAYEMARQLAAAGTPAPMVAVLDIPPVEERRTLRRVIGRAVGRLAGPLRRKPPVEGRQDLYERAMRAYVTPPYEGRLLVVRASERQRVGVGADPALGWRGHASQVSTLDAPGDHLGILRSGGARVIAEALRRELP